jgi:ATP-binding cassette, subfamily B, bacterial
VQPGRPGYNVGMENVEEKKGLRIPFRGYWEILEQYLRRRAPTFVLLAFLICAGIALQLANPQLIRRVIDGALGGSPSTELLLLAGLFILIAFVQQGLGVAAAWVGENLAWKATNELRADLAAHCISLDMRYHNDTTPGELIQRIDGDVAEFSNFFSQLVIRILANVLLIVGILAALYLESPAVGGLFTLFAAVTLVSINLVKNLAVGPEKLLREANTELSGFLEERLAGTEDIRSSGAVGYVLAGLYALQRRILSHWKSAGAMHFWIRMIAGVVLIAGYAAAFVAGAALYRQGLMTVGTVFLMISYINLLSRPIRELSQQVDSLQSVGASVERIRELKAVTPTIADGPGPDLPAGEPLGLELRAVSFAYLPGEPVLRDLSVSVPPGRVLGVLGRTGSGKTTIARLLFRLYEPSAGAILVGGRPVAQARLADLRGRVAMVTQDVQLFQATVRENITLFDERVSDDRIRGAVGRLGLSAWLAGLPLGLDTRLETGGRSLSAGEAQLLAFTRVFLRDPGLVILDEASSRLDPATERLIERAVDALLEGRTAMVIAHRLGTVERADDILILDQGRAVEHGERARLAADPGSRFSGLLRAALERGAADAPGGLLS